MTYIKVKWLHASESDPVWLYSELDEKRWETRKVEIYEDGRTGWADATSSFRDTQRGEMPAPSLQEISRDPQFVPEEIGDEEFESVWAHRGR